MTKRSKRVSSYSRSTSGEGRGEVYNFIGGGQNAIANPTAGSCPGTYNAIVGGFVNCIDTVGGANPFSSCYNFIGGGQGNIVCAGSCFSSVTGGCNNSTFSQYSFVGGGAANLLEGCYSSIAGGFSNFIHFSSGYSAIAGGNTNCITSSSYNSFIGGGLSNTITASAYYSVILGIDKIN